MGLNECASRLVKLHTAQLTVGHFVPIAGVWLRLDTAPAGIARGPGRAVLIQHRLAATDA